MSDKKQNSPIEGGIMVPGPIPVEVRELGPEETKREESSRKGNINLYEKWQESEIMDGGILTPLGSSPVEVRDRELEEIKKHVRKWLSRLLGL